MRHAILGSSLLLLLLASAAVQAQPKEYTLQFKGKPVVGQKTLVTDADSTKFKLKLVKNKKVMLSESETDQASFTFTRTVLEVDGDEVTRESLAFEKAVHVVEGKKIPYGFQGKTVIVVSSADGASYALEDGTALSEADLEGIKKVKSDRKKGEKGGDELLNPPGPVKAGGSWKPDLKTLATGMLDLKNDDAVDLDKSSAKLTLLKVTEKDGIQFAAIKGSFKLWVYEIGDMRLTKPVLTKITIKGDICADGSKPDGTMEMKMTIKGSSPMEMGDQEPVTVQLDMSAEMKKTVASVEEAPPAPAP